MNIHITHTITASPDLLAALNNLFGGMPGSSKPTKAGSFKQPAVNGSASNGQATTTETTAADDFKTEEPAGTEVETDTAKADTVKAITIEQIREAVQKKAAEGKTAKVKTLLGEFGADKVTNLQKENYADFHQKLEAI